MDKAQAAGVNVQKGRKGEQIALGKASLRFLSPDRGTAGTDANEDGMVVELTYGGFEGLFTGDIGTETEKKTSAGAGRCRFSESGTSWLQIFTVRNFWMW